MNKNTESDYGFLDSVPARQVNVTWQPDQETITKIAEILNIKFNLPQVTIFKTNEEVVKEVDTTLNFDDSKIERYEAFEYQGMPVIRLVPKQSGVTHTIKFTSEGVKGLEAVQEYLLAA